MARRFEKLPPGAASHLQGMAAAGLLSESRAALALGMPLDQFREVITEHKPSREIWQTALAIERDQLLEALYSRAIAGDSAAARTLLAVRHGLSEKATTGGPPVHISFNLPAAQSPEEYLKAVTVTPEAPKALSNGED